jgi:DNA-binding Lrp family transcriptional regulator
VNERWITISEIAERLGLSRPTVRKRLGDGDIEGLVAHLGYSRVERRSYEAWEKAQLFKDRGKTGKVG